MGSLEAHELTSGGSLNRQPHFFLQLGGVRPPGCLPKRFAEHRTFADTHQLQCSLIYLKDPAVHRQ